MKRNTIFAAMLAFSVAASAQINSPEADGYIARGLRMWYDKNYPGTLDQLGEAERLVADAGPDTDLWRGLASAMRGEPQAELLLNRFLDTHPASPLRCRAIMALADIDFGNKKWADAFATYSLIDPRSLDSETAADLTYRTGYCRLMLGDYDQALSAMEELANNSRYAQASLFYRGYIAYARGDYRTALSLMQRVKPEGHPGVDAPYYIMQMQFEKGNWQKAADAARQLIDRPEANPQYTIEALRVAGESLYNLGEETQAVGYLWKYAAMAADPAPSAFYILGVSEYRAGNNDAAIKLLQKVIPADNALAQSAYLFLGQAYMRRGDNSEALMAFENAYRLNYDRRVQETAFYNYAVARMEGGRVPFGSSVDMLEDFLREFPDSRYAPEVQGFIVNGYMTDNDYESALRAIDRMKNPSPKILEARRRALFVLATREYQAGKITEAEKHLRTLQQADAPATDNLLLQSRIWLGDCLYTRGDYNGAARQYEAFIKSAPSTDTNLATAYYDLGYARFSAGKYAEALKAFSRAEKLLPESAHVRYLADISNRMGDCRYYTSDFSGAVADYRKAYSRSPESGDYALYQLAIVKGLQGDHRGKISDIDRLIKEFPSTGLVPQALLEKAESQAAVNDIKGAVATYNTLVGDYASTAPGRNGYLQLALIYLNNGNRDKAISTYREVIRKYPSSDEARLAADDLKRQYAADGSLAEYAEFVKSVPGAPTLDAVEMDILAFEAAEQAYLTAGKTDRVADYLNQFPKGANRAKALFYQAEDAWNSGNTTRAAQIAGEIAERYPHSEAAEGALLIKGNAESALGKHSKALDTFRALEKSASDARTLHNARMGSLRASAALGRHKEVVKAVDELLASSATPAESADEARYLRAESLDALGRHKEADKEWAAMAKRPASLYGAMSAVALAQSQLDRGLLKEAAATADAFINANPPQQYWLARGFIVYSDILRKRGDTFEADEYLKSLRANYPGKETDIRDMINQRLK